MRATVYLKLCKRIVVILFITMIFLHLLAYVRLHFKQLHDRKVLELKQYPVTTETAVDFTQKHAGIQEARIKRLNNVCTNMPDFSKSIDNYREYIKYYYSSEYNFSICNVPKVGSTFWTQALKVLKYGTDHAKPAFSKSRAAVHMDSRELTVDFKSNEMRNSRTVLVSRDPYSRLFSAYVDKLFLPLMYTVHIKAARLRERKQENYSQCPQDISFQDFLNVVIHEADNERPLNNHWAPITFLCSPCDVNTFLLVKQETFSTDVQYFLTTFPVDKEIADTIVDALYSHRAESTIPGIVETVYYFMNNSEKAQDCFGWYGVAKRLWISFQIQGFLKDIVPFPSENDFSSEQLKSSSYMTTLILNAIKINPMSSEDMKQQRQSFLVSAYNTLDKETIRKIQQIYKPDFELFDYTTVPPTGAHNALYSQLLP